MSKSISSAHWLNVFKESLILSNGTNEVETKDCYVILRFSGRISIIEDFWRYNDRLVTFMREVHVKRYSHYRECLVYMDKSE